MASIHNEHMISIRVPRDVLKRLDKICEKADRSRSWIVRRLIDAAVSKNAKSDSVK